MEKKIVIVGAGNVGTALCYTLSRLSLFREIVLVDMVKEKAEGEALDISESSAFSKEDVRVRAGTYSDCKDASFIVITASAKMDIHAQSRREMLSPTKKVMKSICQSIKASGFQGIVVVVSNPLDVMTYYAAKLLGLPQGHVIGSGTNLDTGRLRHELAELFHVPSKKVEGYVLGEHGESEVIPYSQVRIAGRKLLAIQKEHPELLQGKSLEDLRKDNLQAGFEIFHRKGNTCYGIACSVSEILRSMVLDEGKVLPVSVASMGHYDIDNCYLSLPTRLTKDGATEIIDLPLTEKEREALKSSARSIQSFYPDLED